MSIYRWVAALAFLAALDAARAQDKNAAEPPFEVREHYTKYEYRVPMRDGVRLFTVVHVPKDQSKSWPFLVLRTPYGVSVPINDEREYGVDYVPNQLGPSKDFDKAGYIFVRQDVRGRFMSEGAWKDVGPHPGNGINSSTDMFDTVEWLLKNVPNHNGKVGIWGISYPGYYTSASIIDSHPAIKAASPQAPMTDLFMGDDAYHGGAFMLADNYRFYRVFKLQQNPTPEPKRNEPLEMGTASAYDYFLRLKTLSAMSKTLSPEKSASWFEQIAHDTYDSFWQERNLAPRLKNIKCAVLTVGGWYDAEDLSGPFSTFHAVERQDPDIDNHLVIGPWVHGGWARFDGARLGHASFDAKTSEHYQKKILLPFFEHHLKAAADAKLAKAMVFETGTNVWRDYPAWPPPRARTATLYLQPGGALGWKPPPPSTRTFDEYVSDPDKPVPFIGYVSAGVPQEYMVSDQRFAATRPDVLVYQTSPLETDVTAAGPVSPQLFVSSSGTDSDWIVKLIDVYPDDLKEARAAGPTPSKDVELPRTALGGLQQLVRGWPLRAKFRRSFEKPEALVPGEVTPLTWLAPDINHTFRRGHRIMVQIQSSWFPLIDLNPQRFLSIPAAKPEEFSKATQRVYRAAETPSGIGLMLLP